MIIEGRTICFLELSNRHVKKQNSHLVVNLDFTYLSVLQLQRLILFLYSHFLLEYKNTTAKPIQFLKTQKKKKMKCSMVQAQRN